MLNVFVRHVREDEFLKVYDFISGCKPLESHSQHFYKIMLRYFGNCCFVAENDEKIIGFILGLISQVHTNTYFLWQIGVDNSRGGEGIGTMLLTCAENEVKKIMCNRIEVTIDPENTPSKRLFEKMGYYNISSTVGEVVEVMGNMAVKDYYRPGHHFMVYEKKL